MDTKLLKNQIEQRLDNATPEELESILRVLKPTTRWMPLRYKAAGQGTAFLEIPADIAEGVRVMIRSHFPERALVWDNGQSALEQDIEKCLARMRGRG